MTPLIAPGVAAAVRGRAGCCAYQQEKRGRTPVSEQGCDQLDRVVVSSLVGGASHPSNGHGLRRQ
jgi:hypothetical protein